MGLTVRDVQRLLTAAGYYRAGIDGDFGPKSREAVDKLVGRHSEKVSPLWSERRLMVASAQIILDAAGFEPGFIDGYDGHNTVEAYNAWAYEQAHGKREVIAGREDVTVEDQPEFDAVASLSYPRQRDVERYYGPVGKNQAIISLPYVMRLAWNTETTIQRMSCHEKVAKPMEGIFQRVHEHYGDARIRQLRLDLFGGCLNVRKMRGGSSYSMHSWGIAWDLDPANNRLRWGADRAAFARPEYSEYWRIVYDAGAISLGKERNFDWMHSQFARL